MKNAVEPQWLDCVTRMARLPCLIRTRSWIPMIPYLRLLWSYFSIYGFMLLFLFSIFSDWRSLKIENENNSTKTLTAEAQYHAALWFTYRLRNERTVFGF